MARDVSAARRRPGRALALATAASAVLVAIVSTPCARHESAPRPARLVAAVSQAVGSLVCHQRPERSFVACGRPWPVCARCAGLYGGVAAGAWLGWAVVRRRTRRGEAQADPSAMRGPVVLAGSILAAAWAAEAFGLAVLTPVARWATAVPLGAAGGWVVARAVARDLA